MSSLEELNAVFGEPKGDTVTDNPVIRALGGWWDSMGQRGENMYNAYVDPDVSTPEGVGHGLAQSGGAVLDTVAAPMSLLMDAAVPGSPLRDLMPKLMETEAGKYVANRWGELDETTKLRVSSGAVPLEVLASALGMKAAFNPVMRNAWGTVPGFYEGPLGQILGTAWSFGNKGGGAAFRQAITPGGQALLREGVPQGLVDEVTSLAGALRFYDQVKAKVKSGENMLPEEREAWDMLLKTSTAATDKSAHVAKGRDMPSQKRVRTFLEGALLTRLNMLQQQGHDTGLLETLVKNPYASNVSKASDQAAKDAMGLPDNVGNRVINHVKAVHGLGDDDIIMNRTATGIADIYNEAWGNTGTAQGRLYQGFETGGQLDKLGIDRFTDHAELAEFVGASRLGSKDQATYFDLSRRKASGDVLSDADKKVYAKLTDKRAQGKKLTPKQEETLARINKDKAEGNFSGQAQKTWERLNTRLDEVGRVKVSEPDDQGFVYFQDTHRSQDKSLGGVNTITAVNPETGQAFGVISDGSDLFGITGPGNKKQATIVEPIEWNIYDKQRKGSSRATGAPTKSTEQEAITAGERYTGVPYSGEKLPGGGKGPGMLMSYADEALSQYRPQPQARDYISAAGNVAKVGTGAGLLGGAVAAHNYQEQQ